MKRISQVAGLWLLVLMAAASAAAQPAIKGDWGHGTTLNVFAGAATDSSTTGELAGAAVGWEITPRLALEGTGAWFDRGAGADAFAATVKLQAALSARSRWVPFVSAGAGLYHASFDPNATTIPGFYHRRIEQGTLAASDDATFTDPALVLGGGVNLFVKRHVALRPTVALKATA